MHDKRLTTRLIDYWNHLRKDAPLPQIALFNHIALEDVIGKCCMWRVEVKESAGKVSFYTYEYVGEEVKQAIGKDLTGGTFSPQFRNFPAARILNKIDEVVKNSTVIADAGQFVNEKSKIVKYRSCLLPFGTKDGKVTNILLGISWHEF